VVGEEIGKVNAISFGVTLGLQDDLFLAYLLGRGNEEQKKKWLPGFASGDLIGALAMTEPGTGSDLQGMRTSARRDGDHWVVNGQKTFISSGIMADLVVLAVRTDPAGGSRGFSLLMVESDHTPGYERGRKLDKIGLPAQDTSELYFTDARVPVENLLGEEGLGLRYLMSHLPRERLGVSNQSITTARAIYEQTVDYLKDRTALGSRLVDLQATRFTLAEIETELDVAQAYVDASVIAFNKGELTPVEAAKGKWYVSELMKRVVDRCLQLHGGYGFMREYAVGKAYVDTRIQTIYGGTTEIMKEIVGRDIAAR
jgi:alkylation response protein AidB-like acyl-CoA dehydrogenase